MRNAGHRVVDEEGHVWEITGKSKENGLYWIWTHIEEIETDSKSKLESDPSNDGVECIDCPIETDTRKWLVYQKKLHKRK